MCGGPLGDDGAFRYSYLQSIYRAPVEESLEGRGLRIAIRAARSADRRAVEYFRWDGPIRQDERGFVQDAPPNEVEQLVIRISPEYTQRVSADGWSCDLPARFSDAVVTVRVRVLPALAGALR